MTPTTRRSGGLLVMALLAAALLVIHPASGLAADPPGASPMELQLVPAGRAAPRVATAWEREGVLYLGAGEMALLLDAVKHWRSELGRMTFSVGSHEFSVLAGSDIALIDAGRLVHLPGPAFMWEGRMMIPLALIVTDEGKARSWIQLPVTFSRETGRLAASGVRGGISRAEILHARNGWRLELEGDGPIRYDLVSADRSNFVLRITGAEYDPLLFPLPTEHEWFQGLRLRNLGDGIEVGFSPSLRAVGYSVTRPEPHEITVLLGVDERDLRVGNLRSFSSVRERSPGGLVRIALDPGHGKDDPGEKLNGGNESFLALELCKILQDRLPQELGLDVVLTRDDKESPLPQDRAGRAHAEGADLFLSIHLHSREGGPAAFVADVGQRGAPGDATLATMGFRSQEGGQGPHVATSRMISRFLVDAVAERLTQPVGGVYTEPVPELSSSVMPALLLEMGSGSRNKKWTRDRLKVVADGIVDGLRLYRVAGGGR